MSSFSCLPTDEGVPPTASGQTAWNADDIIAVRNWATSVMVEADELSRELHKPLDQLFVQAGIRYRLGQTARLHHVGKRMNGGPGSESVYSECVGVQLMDKRGHFSKVGARSAILNIKDFSFISKTNLIGLHTHS